MCEPSASVTAALSMLDQAFDFLNAADLPTLPTEAQAGALKALERAEAKHTAARANVLSAFTATAGPEADGQGTARAWLRWQTRVTRSAAAGSVAWMKRLAAHPVIGQALAAGDLSASWARHLCAWTDRLPEGMREGADRILCDAARVGADLGDLAALAEAMYERTRQPDEDDGFDDRYFRLGVTFRGAGRADGDLTPGCAAALSAVLDALSKKAGPEDTRTAAQRRHDALEEACRRLITAGMVPGRAGQPTQIQVHLGLGQLRNLPGAAEAESAWAQTRADARRSGTDGTPGLPGWLAGPGEALTRTRAHRPGRPGWLTGAEAQAAACDATIVPVVTGHVDWAALARLTDTFLAVRSRAGQSQLAATRHGQAGPTSPGQSRAGTHVCGCICGKCTCPVRMPLSQASRQRLSRSLLALAADTLSGPGGLAATLRTLSTREDAAAHAPGPLAAAPLAPGSLVAPPLSSVSLPLDVGAATETIPAHLRRAATLRHPHCAFAGCYQPASVCEIHHLVPRAEGGVTALHNLVPLCRFHHLIAIHRWGWTLRLNPDGTTTATSPDGTRNLHSHSPPGQAA